MSFSKTQENNDYKICFQFGLQLTYEMFLVPSQEKNIDEVSQFWTDFFFILFDEEFASMQYGLNLDVDYTLLRKKIKDNNSIYIGVQS